MQTESNTARVPHRRRRPSQFASFGFAFAHTSVLMTLSLLVVFLVWVRVE